MPQERDVDELYEPWDVLIKGLRVGELNVGFTSDAESQDPKAPAFQILLGVSDSSENDEERIAIVGQFSMSTEYAYIKVTCLAPLLVRGDLSSDLNTTEGRRRVLKNTAGSPLIPSGTSVGWRQNQRSQGRSLDSIYQATCQIRRLLIQLCALTTISHVSRVRGPRYGQWHAPSMERTT